MTLKGSLWNVVYGVLQVFNVYDFIGDMPLPWLSVTNGTHCYPNCY